jgi:hypothetical protein
MQNINVMEVYTRSEGGFHNPAAYHTNSPADKPKRTSTQIGSSISIPSQLVKSPASAHFRVSTPGPSTANRKDDEKFDALDSDAGIEAGGPSPDG